GPRPAGADPCPPGPPGRPPRGQPVSDARSAAAAPADARQPEAGAAARKSGAAATAGVRRSALDRYRDPGPPRQPGRECPDGPARAPGQLSPRVPTRLGHKDLLY